MTTINKPDTAVIHHSASGLDATVADIDDWHKKRGWKGIGYHHAIYTDGSVHAGRPVSEQGAHVWGWNENSVGVVLIGDFTKHTPTQAQIMALALLLANDYSKCTVQYHGPIALPGHETECPGKFMIPITALLRLVQAVSHAFGIVGRVTG